MSESAFTLVAYQSLLQEAIASGYSFLAFNDPAIFQTIPVCLLRHDIDTDLASAIELARIEAKLSIRSTYFLMLRSPLYNLLGRANHRMIQEILSLGHWIGLHYDAAFYPDSRRSMEEWILWEAHILGDLFNSPIGAVSFHQPAEDILTNRVTIRGLVNTYDREYLRGFQYVSDSNKIWKKEPPNEIFRKKLYDRLHLLLHPMWWTGSSAKESTEAAWNRAILSNWRRSQEQLLETERAYGSPRSLEFIQNNSLFPNSKKRMDTQ